MGEEYILKTEKLEIGYDGITLVKGIDIAVKKGQIISVIGPNGSGKSTLLKSLSGQLRPISGRVYISGMDLNKLSDREISRHMALLLTDRVRTNFMTCYEVAAMGRYPYTGLFGKLSEKDKEIIKDILKRLKLYDIRDAEFSKISDGQRQRILLARALIQEPDIMILDEPTSFLDIKYKLEFFTLLKTLVKEGSFGVLMSIHEPDLARQLSDKFICLKDGRADRFDTGDKVFKNGYINELFGIKTGSYDESTGRIIL